MARRIFCAVLATETNSFSPIRIDLRAFEASLLARPGEHPDTPTLCSAVIPVGRDVCRRLGWDLIEGTAAWADPAGLVARETYELLRDEILVQLQCAGPLDMVVLGLHGAMIAEGYDDPEGDFLEKVRAIVGPDVPVIATTDPHSHLSAKRVANLDALIAFKEFPHVDYVERAADIWRLAEGMLCRGVKPVMSVYDCRMIDVFPTSRQPMRQFVDDLYELERVDDTVISASLIHGFMAGDVPDMGTKMLVITDGNRPYGDALAEQLGLRVWEMRGKVRSPEVSVVEALDRAVVAQGEKPVVIADIWDNPGGGTAGDGTILLQHALERGLKNVAVGSIWDPIAVQICHAAGEGARLALRFGAKSAPLTGDPIDGEVEVLRNVVQAEQRFGDGYAPIGDASLIRIGDIYVILNSTRAQCFDRSLFEIMGVRPEEMSVLIVKSTNHFYHSFAQIADVILYCSAGQPYPHNPRVTDYKKVREDIWPRNLNRLVAKVV
ncbi:M81 family metallopeptidase [Polycladidibacter hongkongensis]|uniref:M81 family metallopeptidase n=1 Tax=Polycladidibacter hongkongensis TaxID=1647556 RepID=UPI000829D3C2|nr:M81 family metallopeptidase [Pseudovibrio hongkongensis]